VKTLALSRIAALLELPAPPGLDLPITGMAHIDEAGPTELTFLGQERLLPALGRSRAAAVIIDRRLKPAGPVRPALLPVADVDLALARVLAQFAPPVPRPQPGVDPAARVDATARLGQSVAVGPLAVIGPECVIGHRSVIHAGVVIGAGVEIGEDCELFPNVVVRERVTIGHRVVLHSGAVVGTDGFGYRWDGTQHVKIPQIGTVIIEDDVEIGSCSCVDRAKFGATRIGRGTKIDNLVQIGHNAQLGPNCMIVGQAGVAGSARLGAGVVMGGQAGVKDHTILGDGVRVAACAAVMADVPAGETVSGYPAFPHRQSLREQAALRDLPELRVLVRKLQKELAQLRAERGDQAAP
jgi:UDP-3-O-[3-hydroxymyristoyl] glucosamine N-acyltransferase